MKQSSKRQLKELIMQCLDIYFKESGVNQILLTLYENKTRPTSQNRISNILEENRKIVSKTQQLRQKYGDQDYYSDEDRSILGSGENKVTGTQGTRIRSPHVKMIMNEHIDPLANDGASILDDVQSLPQFLVKGLSKLRRNA